MCIFCSVSIFNFINSSSDSQCRGTHSITTENSWRRCRFLRIRYRLDNLRTISQNVTWNCIKIKRIMFLFWKDFYYPLNCSIQCSTAWLISSEWQFYWSRKRMFFKKLEYLHWFHQSFEIFILYFWYRMILKFWQKYEALRKSQTVISK